MFGKLSDNIGRRKLFVWTLAVYLASSGLTALIPKGTSWIVCLYATRVIAGMGIGGEYSATNSAIDEMMPARYSEASKEALRLAAQEARWRQAPLIAVSAYEPPIGPVGGFPGSAMHTGEEQRATAEAELRATVDEERGDQAGQTELCVSAGLAA